MDRLALALVTSLTLTIAGCGDDDGPAPGDVDAALELDPDAGLTDGGGDPDAGAPTDAAPSCLDDHAAGDRFAVGDGCNFCDCQADGTTVCTDRTCVPGPFGCEYDGADHAYGERFGATDDCNECTCAASGLACTRRDCPGGVEDGAILLESLDESCGDDPGFTTQAVLDGLPHSDLTAPFLYDRARALYPESLPDTTMRLRIVYDGGIAVCRLPSPDQPAIDLEVTFEWITADGAFDEGLSGYLRRNNFGFVDAWFAFASAELGELSGSYVPSCGLDPGGYGFFAQIDKDGAASGSVSRVCETDLLFDIGVFTLAP